MENNFYNESDFPSTDEKVQMWKNIQRQNEFLHTISPAPIIHWRSFIFGCAASVLLLLAGFGAFSLVSKTGSQNHKKSLDSAYSEAMNRLLDAAPEASLTSESGRQAVESRFRGIEDLDAMIEEIRNDMLLSGSTQIKKKQLRALYAMKMDMVKELVLEGEISL